jgi:hypothetical protein
MTAHCVALLLALAAPALAQTKPGAPDANGPAARRLRQLIAAVESGSTARIRAFVRAAYAPEVWRRSNEDRVVRLYAMMSDASRGWRYVVGCSNTKTGVAAATPAIPRSVVAASSTRLFVASAGSATR